MKDTIRTDDNSDQGGGPTGEEKPKRSREQEGAINVSEEPGLTGTGGDMGERIAAEAQRYIGSRYVFATHGPESFDAPGLVSWVVLQTAGRTISPDSHAQFTMGTPVDLDGLQPGDILFYDTMNGMEVREGNAASHVGIFVGNGQMVNALNEDRGVIASDPFSEYFKPRYLGARRLV